MNKFAKQYPRTFTHLCECVESDEIPTIFELEEGRFVFNDQTELRARFERREFAISKNSGKEHNGRIDSELANALDLAVSVAVDEKRQLIHKYLQYFEFKRSPEEVTRPDSRSTLREDDGERGSRLDGGDVLEAQRV